MTVCIAAIADNDKTIILATDQMMSVGVITSDLPMVIKLLRVHPRWFALYAGDVTQVSPILRKAGIALAPEESPSVAQVCSVFVRTYHEERAKIAEQQVLSPLGWDMPTFTSLLSTSDTVEVADTKRRIQDLDFNCAFLVGGFDSQRKPHIFAIQPPGVESHYDPIRFWAIGSGADAAVNSLLFRKFSPLMSLKEALYHVAEAKYLAEAAMGVGKSTLFFRHNHDGTAGMVSMGDVPKLRELWETDGQAPIPDNLETRVPGFITPSESEEPEEK